MGFPQRKSPALAGLALIALAGCSVSPEKVPGPNGRDAYVMRCNGAGRSMAECLKAAGDLCPAGYDIVAQTSERRLMKSKEYLTVECR